MLFEAQQYCFKSQFSYCCEHFIINTLKKKKIFLVLYQSCIEMFPLKDFTVVSMQ